MSVVKENREVIVIIATAIIGFLFYYFAGFHPIPCVIIFGFIMGVSVAVIRATRRLSKKRNIINGIVWLGFLAFLFLNPVSLVVIGLGIHVTQNERRICNPKVYTPAAETLALYCQSYPLLKPYLKSDHHDDAMLFGFYPDAGLWVSEDLFAIAPEAHGRIRQDGLQFEIGGGFHHYGYGLSLDPKASSASTNVWKLHMYSEGSPSRHLLTFHMDAARQFTADELRSRLGKRERRHDQ